MESVVFESAKEHAILWLTITNIGLVIAKSKIRHFCPSSVLYPSPIASWFSPVDVSSPNKEVQTCVDETRLVSF